MRILFIGDVFGNTGRRVLAERLEKLVEQESIDFCIANGENAAGGRGLTSTIAKKLHKYGVQVITGGNHSFANSDIVTRYEAQDPTILRPANFPPGNPGLGHSLITLDTGLEVGIVNLVGRTYAAEMLDCPFRKSEAIINELRQHTPIIIVDFHAEATSEKIAFAHYVDGKVSAVLGTHTHVQTADERILSKGTAFISDAGMTGPEHSIIGIKPEPVIRRFLLQTYVRFEPSESSPMLNGVIVEVDESSGKALSISRVYERIMFRQ
jgi:hypothetical protein